MSKRATRAETWAEMARRKLQFHPDREWHEISLWGLFNWGHVRPLIDEGLLLTHMRKENKIVWVRPSREAWERYIQPLIVSAVDEAIVEHTAAVLEERVFEDTPITILSRKAGW